MALQSFYIYQIGRQGSLGWRSSFSEFFRCCFYVSERTVSLSNLKLVRGSHASLSCSLEIVVLDCDSVKIERQVSVVGYGYRISYDRVPTCIDL